MVNSGVTAKPAFRSPRGWWLCALVLAGCGPQHEVHRWTSQPNESSRYRATLIEDSYGYGESNQYSLRIDAAPSGRSPGYFFIQPIDSGGAIHIPRPVLTWTSPTALLVTTKTEALEGQVVRTLGSKEGQRETLTLRYIAAGAVY